MGGPGSGPQKGGGRTISRASTRKMRTRTNRTKNIQSVRSGLKRLGYDSKTRYQAIKGVAKLGKK